MRALNLPKQQHPLVALVSYNDMNMCLPDAGDKITLEFYKISFKIHFNGKVKYGQGHYDFEEGGLAFLAPHQIVTISGQDDSYEGYSLYFHPDFLRNYPLGKTIAKFGFFSYAVCEALYLSDKEKKIIAGLFEAIASELDNNIDHFSQDVLIAQLELLLSYSNRFYNRQFITRKVVYNDLIVKMNEYLSARIDTKNGLPTVQEVSDYLEVSPRYLTDMLKSLTGLSTQQHIHHMLIDKAKTILSTSNLTIAEVAYQLGFEHPQSFNKLFKQKTNISPVKFRQSFN